MKSFTLDDIYHDYDYYHKYNISCEYQGDNKITKIKKSYNPKRKIRRNIYENLRVKHYIKIGETCPICYDSINNRKNSFLTDCGHAFHYSCIIDYDYCIIKNKINNYNICCPICRQFMGDYKDIKDRYPYSKNELDKLDDFENNIKIKVPNVCFDSHQIKYKNHFSGMNYKNCFYCRL